MNKYMRRIALELFAEDGTKITFDPPIIARNMMGELFEVEGMEVSYDAFILTKVKRKLREYDYKEETNEVVNALWVKEG